MSQKIKQILIVDDVKGWRDFNSNIIFKLFGNNAEIKIAACAKDAYDILLQEKPFDIIITDLQMEDDFSPKYAGEWLIEQIQSFNRYIDTKVVIISASYSARIIADNLGVKYIPKPTALNSIAAYKEALDIV